MYSFCFDKISGTNDSVVLCSRVSRLAPGGLVYQRLQDSILYVSRSPAALQSQPDECLTDARESLVRLALSAASLLRTNSDASGGHRDNTTSLPSLQRFGQHAGSSLAPSQSPSYVGGSVGSFVSSQSMAWPDDQLTPSARLRECLPPMRPRPPPSPPSRPKMTVLPSGDVLAQLDEHAVQVSRRRRIVSECVCVEVGGWCEAQLCWVDPCSSASSYYLIANIYVDGGEARWLRTSC